jgi:hypothetical protein
MNGTGVEIKNYLMLFKNDNSLIHKRNKKKLSKKHLFKKLKFELVKYNNESNILECLKKYLINARKQHVQSCGVILDTNIIIHDITYIPPTPSKYDILCLESELESYKKSDDSLYWVATNILNTGNFIINGGSIDKVLDIINNSKTLNEFYKKINALNIYSITQYQFSEKDKNYVHDPLVINKTLTNKDILTYDKELSIEFYNKFQNTTIPISKVTNTILKSEILPKISLICPFTTKELLFHNILTFLRLDYPRHLLELVIINDTKLENELNLPEDSRIRLLNINNKNGDDERLPFGYKLNLGVKHATNELIMHFFDTSNYNLNLKHIVSQFILTNKNCLLSRDIGIYQKELRKSSRILLPDLSNCIYTKDFWKKCSFEEISHKFYIQCDLTHKWIIPRINEISFIPFLYMSFKIPSSEDVQIDFFKREELTFDLSNLIDKKIKESFDLI